MDNNISGNVQGHENKSNNKGCRIFVGCFVFFVVAIVIATIALFIAARSGMFDDLLRGFEETMKNSVQSNQYVSPNAAASVTESANPSQFHSLDNPSSILEKKSRMEVWHYVYMQREESYKEDLPKEIADKQFNSDSEAVDFLNEEIKNRKYKKNEIEAIKNRLDLYTTKVALENIELEIKESAQEKKEASDK